MGYLNDSATVRVGTFRCGGRTGLMLVFTSYDADDGRFLRTIETDGQALVDQRCHTSTAPLR